MKLHIYTYSNLESVYSLSFPIIKSYCEKHNYKYSFNYENLEPLYKPHWNKFLYAVKLLESNLDTDYFVWFDHDVIIKNFDIKLHDLINQYNFENKNSLFMMSKDPVSKMDFNSGVCIFKNNKQVLDVFKKMLDIRNNPYNYPILENFYGFDFHKKNSLQDTRTFLVHFHENPEHLLSIPHRVLQSFHPAKNQYKVGDFCAHVAGPQGGPLLKYMKEIINIEEHTNN